LQTLATIGPDCIYRQR